MIGSCDRIAVETRSNDSATENMSFLNTIKHWLNSDQFKNCSVDNLEPLDTVWTLANDTQKEQAKLIPADLKGDELALYAVEFAENLDIEISAKDRDHVVMHIFQKAAREKSPIAISEIGASLLFCYQHVEQDLQRAEKWLEHAVSYDDPYAMHALGRMYLAQLTNSADPEIGHDIIKRCAAMEHKPCEDDLAMMGI